MRNYVLYGHDGSANHGCEALVRTTVGLLNCPKEHIKLVSLCPEQDRAYHIDELCTVFQRGTKVETLKRDAGFLRAYYSLKVKKDYQPIDFLYEIQALGVGKGDVALCIGGDSYCYWEQGRRELMRQHEMFKSAGLKTVYWGCSIDEEVLHDPDVAADIASFDLITARETISYETLKKVNENTILVADSAFTLPEIRLPLPAGYDDCGIIGINSSPLVENKNDDQNIVRENYEYLIRSILENTNYKILLVPHVTWKGNDDREVHSALYDKFKESGRIATIEDHDCRELKGYVSRCRFFIGARTHATIAAYSNAIPTLVAGYSTKSKGIAKDLFGTDENYVIRVQDFHKKTDLCDKWNWLQQHEQDIRKHLTKIMPEYTERVYKGKKALFEL